MEYSIVKHVTLEHFKFIENEPRFLKFNGEIYEGEQIKNSKFDGVPRLAHVTDLELGKEGEIILSTVLFNVLTEEYPMHEYVGKCFQIIKHEQREGKNYSGYTVTEIEVIDTESDDLFGGNTPL